MLKEECSHKLLGMDLTTDKLRSLVRKWQTSIEAHVDVKTTDNYTLRMFCIGFTKRRSNQIRRKMREIMVSQATACDLKELVRKFIPEKIGKEIEKATSSIHPPIRLRNTFMGKEESHLIIEAFMLLEVPMIKKCYATTVIIHLATALRKFWLATRK